MKRTGLTIMTIGAMTFLVLSGKGQAEYKGKLNCKNLNSYLMDYNLSDGRVRGLCDGALTACIAEEALGSLPVSSPLHADMGGQLKANLDLQMNLCEVGFAAFAPTMYKDNLAR